MNAKRIRAAILAMFLSASMIASGMSGAVFAGDEAAVDEAEQNVQTEELQPSEETAESETSESETAESETTESETTESEIAESETTEPETTDEESEPEEAEDEPAEEADDTAVELAETSEESTEEAEADEVVLAEGEIRQIWLTTAGAKDQRCTLAKATDAFGRTYQRVIPDASVSPSSDMAPAFFTTNVGENVMKVVLRTKSSTVPKCSCFMSNGSGGYTVQKTVEAVLDDGKTMTANVWNTVYIDMTSIFADATYKYLWGLMFRPYASEAVSSHVGDEVEIGYIGFFGTLEDAKAHTSTFEGDFTISDVLVGGTSIGNVSSYEYDLGGLASVPALTVAATGDTSNVTVTNGTLGADGTATSTVMDGATAVVTVNFVNGAHETDVEPLKLAVTILQAANNRCNGSNIADEFGRTRTVINPVWQYYDSSTNSDKEAKGSVSPGGGGNSALNNSKYTAIKLVYRSTSNTVPSLSLFNDGFTKSGTGVVYEAVTANPGNWQTVIYENPMSVPMMWFMINFAPTNTEVVDGTTKVISDVFEVGYIGAFGSVIDAKKHVSAFEGDFTISDVLLGGTSIGNVTSYDYDLEGSSSVPALTVKATGNTNGVTITNGTLGTDGTATSTVKNGDNAVVTVNFTNGSTDFTITGISVNGKALAEFDRATSTYNVALGYGAAEPSVTYTFSGEESATAEVVTTAAEGGYKTEIKNDGAVLYTINFTVSTEKPELINTLYKLNTEKNVTVGYLGGSVTAGTASSSPEKTSWRAITRDWIKSTFPNAKVTEVNDAVGGTGVIFGLFRAENRYFAKNGGKAPDINFIEMAINDAYDGVSGNIQYVYIESLIKKIYASNPKADIVLVVTGDSGQSAKEVGSATPVFGKAYTDLAAYYDIPIVYPFRELMLKMAAENGGSAVTNSSSDLWKKYFHDGVHPIDLGYAEYANTIINYLVSNLPTEYAPAADEYTEKTLPATTYCETNGKGELMVDAYGFDPTKITGTEYFGGYKVETDGSYKPIRSRKEGDVISLNFKASGIGMWTWSYGTTNGINGTNITYSIDGGTPTNLNVYRSYPNHKSYMLADGLDPAVEHTIRIYHSDASANLDIYYFYLWGFEDGTTYDSVAMSAVPYLDTETAVVTAEITVGESKKDLGFSFDKHEYQIPMTLVNGEYVITLAAETPAYPTIDITLPEGYYGYTLTQAGEGGTGTNAAVLSIDNVGVYTFEFILDGVPDGYTAVSATAAFGNAAKITFAEATTQKLEIKRDEETEYTLYEAGITEITGLSAGLYKMRYTDGENAGTEVDVRIWETYPENANVYYVTDGGTGDGLTPENPAAIGTVLNGGIYKGSLAVTFENFKKAFSTAYKDSTKVNYIVFLGDVTNEYGAAAVDFSGSTETVFTSEYGAVFYLKNHINHSLVRTDLGTNVGKLTWKNIDVILGDPTKTTQGAIDGEIYYTAWGQNVTFDNFNIVGYAKNEELNITRKKGLYINYFADGTGTYTLINPQPVTVNSPGLYIEGTRTSAYCSAGVTVNSDVNFVINGGAFTTLSLGPHGNDNNPSTTNGNAYATINGGKITTAYVGGSNNGDKRILNGSALVVVNGGTIGKITAKDGNPTNDAVLIVNNGLNYTVDTTYIDYYIKSGANGSANAVLASDTKTLSKLTFETDKRYVYIDAGTANEKKIEAVDGVAEIAASEITTGTHNVTYRDNDFIVTYSSGANKYATVPAAAEYANGDTIDAIADPTFNNGAKYTFLGWSADGTNTVALPYTVTADTTFTALWDVDDTVLYVSDKNGHTDGGDDPSYPLGASSASAKVLTAQSLDFVQAGYNDTTKVYTVKSTTAIDGFTYSNPDASTGAFLNANGKLTSGGTIIVTDEVFLQGGGSTGTITVKGLDENSTAYLVGGTAAPNGDRIFTDIKVVNVYTDEAVMQTGNHNITFTETAIPGHGFYEIDGEQYYFLNWRNYGSSVYLMYKTGTTYTVGSGTNSTSAFVKVTSSSPAYNYKKTTTDPRISVTNYSTASTGTSSITIGNGSANMITTGSNYNQNNANISQAVNGERTVTVNGGTVATVAASHIGYFNGIGNIIINGGTVTNLKLGANQTSTEKAGNAATFGLMYATVNGGTVTTALISGALNSGTPATAREYYSTSFTEDIKSYKRMGVSVLEVNGGTVGSVTSTNANSDVLTRVLIKNGGTITSTPSSNVYDYFAESDGTVKITAAVDTSATLTYNSVEYPAGEKYSFTGFEIETVGTKVRDKLKITKVDGTTETEVAVVDIVDGKASVAKDVLGGKGKFVFSAYSSAGETVELPVKIYVDRPTTAAPSSQSYMRIAIYETGTDTLVKEIVLEGADTETKTEIGEGGNEKTYIEANAIFGAITASGNVDVKVMKNGYLTSTLFKNVSVTELSNVSTISIDTMIAGDIKGSFEATCGDGVVDIYDFIRVLRGFDPSASGNLKSAVDINEDGTVDISDLSLVRTNYGATAE